MPLLDPSTFLSQIFWLTIFFVIQYIVILKFITPLFKENFVKRKAYIEDKISMAEKLTSESEKLKSQYEASIEKSRQENIEHMRQLIQKIKQQSDTQLEKVENELSKDFLRNEKRIEEFIKKASDDLDDIAIKTAENIINKISGKKISAEQLNKYMN